jgi:hypothetical protein
MFVNKNDIAAIIWGSWEIVHFLRSFGTFGNVLRPRDFLTDLDYNKAQYFKTQRGRRRDKCRKIILKSVKYVIDYIFHYSYKFLS